MPTITNYGDVINTGNVQKQGTGISVFAGSVQVAQDTMPLIMEAVEGQVEETEQIQTAALVFRELLL